MPATAKKKLKHFGSIQGKHGTVAINGIVLELSSLLETGAVKNTCRPY